MIKRTIEISSGPARLSIRSRQLVIERDGERPATVPCEDVGLLLIDHPAVSYTHSVFIALADAGAAVALCGGNHTPVSLMLPLAGNAVQTERFRAQLSAGAPLKKQLWHQIVACKLRQQSAVLGAVTAADAGLAAMARQVRSGDATNLEAQAAARYWPRLFGRDFHRRRDGPPPNNLLNYGYMALRAATARALVVAGLLPTVGIHHRNRYNAFCLADDLMEPYRPYVDLVVVEMDRAGMSEQSLGREQKAHLLGVLNHGVAVAGRRTPLLLALQATASSLERSFAARRAALALPDGLPAPPNQPDPENEDGAADV
jgi:CRISPR-associated protein Cas1